MTALLDLAPEGTPPPLLATAEIHAAIDLLTGVVFESYGADVLASALIELKRAESRLAACKHRILRAADTTRVAAAFGATDTSSWAALLTHTDADISARDVKLARSLVTGSPTYVALEAGDISAEHARIITTAAGQLPDGVAPEDALVVERSLVAKAHSLSPRHLRVAARRCIEAITPDPEIVDEHENSVTKSEEDRAYDATTLSLHDNGDGTLTGRFTIPLFQGLLLKKVIDAITAPRRNRFNATRNGSGRNGNPEFAGAGSSAGETRPERITAEHARGLAFIELLEHLPTDHLHTATAATVVVNIDRTALINQLKTAGVDTGTLLSAGEARRLACNAGIIPMVLGGTSVPLDLGRTKRLFTQAHRIAITRTHQTCATHGCERPIAWCELHHRNPWQHGGKTDLANAIPLCGHHHRTIHDQRYQHRQRPDGQISFTRRP
ncbi:MAG: DUF222 domain-containing protein [Marmoricola sp.]